MTPELVSPIFAKAATPSAPPPERPYGLGLYLSTVALATATLAPTALALLPDLAPSWPLAVAAIAAPAFIIVALIFALRVPISDWILTQSHGGALAAFVISIGVFILCGYHSLTRFDALRGLVGLQVMLLPALALEKGYARWYVLCGVTIATAAPRLGQVQGLASVACFAAALVPCLAYDAFYHALRGAPPQATLGSNAWAPLRIAAWRIALAAPIAALLSLATPESPPPIPTTGQPAPDRPVRLQANIDSSIIEVMAYTAILGLLLLACIWLYNWLMRRLKRRQGDLMPESLGVPVGGLRPLEGDDSPSSTWNPRSPMGVIVRKYQEFAIATARRGRPRHLHETPFEFSQGLVEMAIAAEPLAAPITKAFEQARYGATPPTPGDADRFSRLADSTISAITAPSPDAPTEAKPA